MTAYLGKMNGLFHEFNDLLPPSFTLAQELEQQSKLFMDLPLHELVDKYSHVRDQILGSHIIPNFTSTCSSLLRVPCKPLNDPPIFVDDFSTFAIQRDDRNRSYKPCKGRPKCDHCGRLGHKINKCYALHDHHPLSAAIAYNDPPSQSSTMYHTSSDPTDKSAIINEFLKWCKARKPFSSSTFVARTSICFISLTQSSSIGPRDFDSRAINHITSNKSLFSSLSSPNNFPFVTMANGCTILAYGVGTVNIFPFFFH